MSSHTFSEGSPNLQQHELRQDSPTVLDERGCSPTRKFRFSHTILVVSTTLRLFAAPLSVALSKSWRHGTDSPHPSALSKDSLSTFVETIAQQQDITTLEILDIAIPANSSSAKRDMIVS